MCGNCFPDVQRYKLIHIPTGYSIYINRLWYMFFYGRCNLCDFQVCLFIYTLNPQLHSRSATYIKRNGLLIRKITIKSSRPFQCAYHPLTP